MLRLLLKRLSERMTARIRESLLPTTLWPGPAGTSWPLCASVSPSGNGHDASAHRSGAVRTHASVSRHGCEQLWALRCPGGSAVLLFSVPFSGEEERATEPT